MQKILVFPKSFPDGNETFFLKLVLSSDTEFPGLFLQWEKNVVFDDIDHATFRLLPLLYLRIKKAGITSAITGKIKGVYKLTWVKNQRLLDELDHILVLLQSHSIDVLLLKGIPLILDSYKDVGARFLGDADLLVDPRNAKKVISLMLGRGWKSSDLQFPNLNHYSLDTLQRVVKEAHFRNHRHVEIDIHWRLFDFSKKEERFTMASFVELLQRSVVMPFKNRHQQAMSAEDILLHVVVHGAGGNIYRPFRWVVDAVFIIKTHNINWEKFIEYTKKYGFEAEICMGFSYLLEHHFVNLPELVAQQILGLNLSKAAMKDYYKKSDVENFSLSFFEGFKRLWNIYWNYERKGIFPVNIYYFIDYLALVWGLENKRQLPSFIFGKLKIRFIQVVRKYLHHKRVRS